MQEEALQRFLVSVRCQRFIDYLDPIGETADEALARRVRWARMTRNDPAHADEAMFLLQHEVALRKVVATELEFDNGWVEGVDAGAEDGERGWSGRPVDPTIVPEDAELTEEHEFLNTGIMRIEDLSQDNIDRTMDSMDTGPAPRLKAETSVAPVANQVERPDTVTKGPITGPSSLLQPRGAVRTAGPALRRVSHPSLSNIGRDETPPVSNPTLMPPDATPPIFADDEQTDPSARMAPDLIRAIALAPSAGKDFDPVVVGSGGDPDAATVRPAARRDQSPQEEPSIAPATAPRTPVRLGPKDEEGGPPWLIFGFIGLMACAVAGMFALSRPGPVPPEPIPSLPVPAAPAPAPDPTPAVPVPAPTVTPAQPSPKPAVAAPTPQPVVPQPVAPAPDPVVPAPAPVVPAPEPVVPAPEPVVPAPEPVVPAPEPVVPAPEPVVPAPVPEPVAPAPQPVVPEPAPEPVVPAPTPEPVAPAVPEPVVPAPQPVAPAPEPVAPTPAPEPVAPAPAPEPTAASGAPAAVKGLWGGIMGGRGFVLIIKSQEGESITGSAEVLEASGEWSKYQISGAMAGNQLRMTDSSGAVVFNATVDGKKASGTMKRDGTSSSFSVTR